MLTHEEREIIMAANPPEIGSIHYGGCYFDWSWKGCGFGQLDFRVDRESGEIRVANECMGRERVRSILIALANHIADNAILDDER
jgi:hypothetical protein